MKGFLFKCMTVILLVAVLLIFTELGLRLFWSGKPKIPSIPPNPRYQENADLEISYTLIPNHKYNKGIVTTNEFGFRIDPSIAVGKKPGVFRIILLGDSIVFGVRLRQEKTIGAVLQAKLSEIAVPGIGGFEVINLGMPGHNINQYAAVLESYGLKYSPDLIIAGITISNDLEGRQARYLGNGHIYLEPTSSFVGTNSEHSLPPGIIRGSYIWRYLYFRYFEPKRQEEKRRLAIAAGDTPPNLLFAPMHRNDEVWENVKNGISKIDNSAKKSGAELIYLLFPAVEQIYYQDINDAPQRIVKETLKDYDRALFDFYGIFRDVYLVTAVLPFNDLASHPSAKSNEIIASTIRDYIARGMAARLKRAFSGSIKLGFDDDIGFLSFGWGQRRKIGDIRFRNLQGANARVVFGKWTEHLKRIDFLCAGENGCVPQTVDILLNSKKIGSFQILKGELFQRYSILLNKAIDLADFNTIDITIKTPCTRKRARLLARYDRLDTLSLSRIDLR